MKSGTLPAIALLVVYAATMKPKRLATMRTTTLSHVHLILTEDALALLVKSVAVLMRVIWATALPVLAAIMKPKKLATMRTTTLSRAHLMLTEDVLALLVKSDAGLTRVIWVTAPLCVAQMVPRLASMKTTTLSRVLQSPMVDVNVIKGMKSVGRILL
jgi:hypothetical protein